ncbi:MAG: LuxR C-terminal-related transcriptional regulator [Bacteroidota bacterium]
MSLTAKYWFYGIESRRILFLCSEIHRIVIKGKTLSLLFWMAGFLVVFAKDAKVDSILQQSDSLFQTSELSLSEWKRFKRFTEKLELTTTQNDTAQQRLKAYTRDSLQILEVKLMALKMLQSKHLLDQEVRENTAYYRNLVGRLRASSIPPQEYRFLEEKLALLKYRTLENQLAESQTTNRWLLIIVVLLSILILGLGFNFRKKQSPQLSKQEQIIQNLILSGKTNKEIATELFISLSTVKTHITNIYSKLNVSGRAELFQKKNRY